MKKHPKLDRYTIDVDHKLSLLEGDEDDGNSPVLEAYTTEHALELALELVKHARRREDDDRTLKNQLQQRIRKLEEQISPKRDETWGESSLPRTVPEVDVRAFNKIQAIKATRDATGMGLRETKEIVEFVLHHARVINGADVAVPMSTIDRYMHNWAAQHGYSKFCCSGYAGFGQHDDNCTAPK